ncbi:MAG: hypothetical protein HYS12_12970 [Planctomycetes bacterium]|nr:hypothetical protein [Planctomycetota bacterium]
MVPRRGGRRDRRPLRIIGEVCMCIAAILMVTCGFALALNAGAFGTPIDEEWVNAPYELTPQRFTWMVLSGIGIAVGVLLLCAGGVMRYYRRG